MIMLKDYRLIPESQSPISSNPGELFCDEETASLRSRLKWFRMGPFQKYKCRKRYIFKLIIQALKIFFVTLQAVLFTYFYNNEKLFEKGTDLSIHQLFLKDYDMEDPDSLILYTKNDIRESFMFAFNSYYTLEASSLVNITGMSKYPFFICSQKYPHIFTERNEENTNEECYSASNETMINTIIDGLMVPAKLALLEKITLKFRLNIFYDEAVYSSECVEYFIFDVLIKYDLIEYFGMVRPSAETILIKKFCENRSNSFLRAKINFGYFVFILLFLILSSISFILSIRSFSSNLKLLRKCQSYFKERRSYVLSFNEKMEFYNFWFLVYIVNDILSISTCLIFIISVLTDFPLRLILSFIIGINSLLIWLGILRYMGYFESFNFLLFIIKRTSGSSLRFVIFSIIIFAGFTHCAYVTIGPYHDKLNTLGRCSATLFGLMNGDEIYTTYQSIQQDSFIILTFSKIFFSVFTFFFMYIVISIFVAILNDKKHRSNERHLSNIITCFLEECNCSLCSLNHNRHPEL